MEPPRTRRICSPLWMPAFIAPTRMLTALVNRWLWVRWLVFSAAVASAIPSIVRSATQEFAVLFIGFFIFSAALVFGFCFSWPWLILAVDRINGRPQKKHTLQRALFVIGAFVFLISLPPAFLVQDHAQDFDYSLAIIAGAGLLTGSATFLRHTTKPKSTSAS